MEDQQNGCIYETASPVELGAGRLPWPGPHCPAPSGAAGTARRRPIRRGQFPQKP